MPIVTVRNQPDEMLEERVRCQGQKGANLSDISCMHCRKMLRRLKNLKWDNKVKGGEWDIKVNMQLSLENELADVNFPENFQEIVKKQRFKGRKKSLLKKQIGDLKSKSELLAVEEETKELSVAELSQNVEHDNSLSLERVQGVQAEIDRQSAHGVSGGNKSEMSLSLAN